MTIKNDDSNLTHEHACATIKLQLLVKVFPVIFCFCFCLSLLILKKKIEKKILKKKL